MKNLSRVYIALCFIILYAPIAVLMLFSFLTPIFSRYKTTDTFGFYAKALPKLSSSFDLGFWNGTQKTTQSKATYQYYLAMGAESGSNAPKKPYSLEKRAGMRSNASSS